jgi:hypothetical protein
MRLGFANVNGLHGKAEVCKDFQERNDIDIMFLVETWLQQGQSTAIIHPFFSVSQPSGMLRAGGRRANGGILGFGKPEWRSEITMKYEDPQRNFVVIQIQDILIGIGYFPPSLEDSRVFEALETMTSLAEREAKELIICGDLNARCGVATGDHTSNMRGQMLLRHLLEAEINILTPIEGRRTSFARSFQGQAGWGVTDLVLTNSFRVGDLRIFENETLGGSDHRPLVWDVDAVNLPEKEFSRLNIKKLRTGENQELFQQRLQWDKDEILERMHRETADGGWKLFKEWILKAAREICGTMTYKSFTNGEFWSPELTRQKEQCIERAIALQSLVETGASPVIRQRTAEALTHANREFRKMLDKRREQMFDAHIESLMDPESKGILEKMIKTRKGRVSRSSCQLDPNAIERHQEYFQNTFGGEPGGSYRHTLPTEDSREYTHYEVTEEQVQRALKRVPKGKSPGVDNIVGEMLLYGGDTVVAALQILFNVILRSNQIPDDWKIALVVPIHKKGDKKAIENYRPISLTVVVRRLYERIILEELDEAVLLLSDWQGGFRKYRSTLQQVFVMHEVMVGNPDSHHVFLDIKAAYDTVNRAILWEELGKTFRVNESTVARIKTLFDHNISKIVVQGRTSSGLENKRGLLQGSSLSPILFNFYINGLIQRLDQSHKVNTGSLRSNSVFFADDGAIHADTIGKIRELLQICENWAQEFGMVFSAPKCQYMGPLENPNLILNGQQIEKVDAVEYLGVKMDRNGVLLSDQVQLRAGKARSTLLQLQRMGMNLKGWPVATSAKMYKTFVRPQMEYGLQLDILNKGDLEVLEKTQTLALRCMVSGNKNTSRKVLRKLTRMESMETRNQVLNLKFMGNLHNGNDRTIPAVRMYRESLQGANPKTLVSRSRKKNDLWRNAEVKQLPLLFNPLQRHIQPQKSAPVLLDKTKKGIIQDELFQLGRGEQNVASSCHFEKNEPVRHICQPRNGVAKLQKINIIKWIVGNVCNHQSCKICGQEVSRAHGLECSGAESFLSQRLGHLMTEETRNGHGTLLDKLLNQYRSEPPQGVPLFYDFLSTAVDMVYRNCLGFRRKENGFWEAIPTPTAAPAAPPQPNVQEMNPVMEFRNIRHQRSYFNRRYGQGMGRPRTRGRGIG